MKVSMKATRAATLLITIFIVVFLCSCSSSPDNSAELMTGEKTTFSSEKNAMAYTYSDDEYFAINMYLSNFTEIGLLQTNGYDAYSSTYADLLEIGFLYCVFNCKDQIEHGDYSLSPESGSSKKYANSKIKADILLGAVDALLKKRPVPKSIDGLLYDDSAQDAAYFYWAQDADPATGGFSLLTKIEQMGNNRYLIIFNLYNSGGEPTDAGDKKYYDYTKEEALREFPQGVINNISAIIEAGDLSDAETMTLISLPKISIAQNN